LKRAAKPLVIAIFSLLWLVVSIMRVPDGIGTSTDIGIDTSWVIALPETLHQHSISGRDFHFTYGPLAQVLAYAGAAIHTPWSAIDSLPLVMLSFYTASIVLFALVLLLLDSIGWKESLIICFAISGLNLFSEPTAFRPLALMLCAVLFYRALRHGIGWSVGAGIACFGAQLLTFELGLYGVLTAALITAVVSIERKLRTSALTCLTVVAGVYLGLNLALGLLFSGYHHYAFETIQGFTFSQALPWSLAAGPTVGLAIVGALGVAFAVYLRREGALLALLLCSLIQLKSVTVRSDMGHITQGGSPLVFVFLWAGALMLLRWRVHKAALALWAAGFIALWLSWPWAGLYFASDFAKAVTQGSPIEKLSRVRRVSSDLFGVPSSNGPLLAFPYQNYIPVALKRRIVAPVLMSYNASTESLQHFYVTSLEREQNLEVVYGVDNVASTAIDEVQAITRVPLIFDYFRDRFRLHGDSPFGKGFYLLRSDPTPPRKLESMEIATTTGIAANGAMEIRPVAPTACNLLRLNVQMDYSFLRHFGRPTPLELLFFNDGAPFLKTVLPALHANAAFSTYVSLIPSEHFHEIFGMTPIPPTSWDSLQISPRASDWLGVAPHKAGILRMECLKQ
jgi:hypothetical protein